MAKELFNSDFYTLPEQVQINKEDIETNTADITKLKDDIGKIKPNAWEERKFKIDAGEGAFIDSTTYNPITDINIPLNSQKTFADKDTYSAKESINSYSYNLSFTIQELGNVFTYAICADPSCSISDVISLESISKKGIFLQNITGSNDGALDGCNLYIYCTDLKADKIKIEDGYIEHIANSDDSTDTGTILSASVINYHYLRKAQASEIYLNKSDASNTYLSKTDASSTYVSKEDYDNRFDTGVISLTAQGLNKIKGLTDTPNQVLELHVPSDFLELSQQPTGKDLKLLIVYNGSPLYDNIVLHSNKTIGDYDNISSSSPKAVWYTGQAIITLASQSDGLFDIAYHDRNLLGLHLITTF